MKALELTAEEYLPYFKNYIDQAGNAELISGLQNGLEVMSNFYESVSDEKLEYRYADGKWTIKEIINHLLDAERVFCYRAMRFAREDKTPVMGFDENDYAVSSQANDRTIEDLVLEFKDLRKSTINLFKSFTVNMLMCRGVAGGGEVSVRALGFLIIGHEKHHCSIIKERYL